ncbi:alkaline phosphatase, tissue-nonspecific isozyme-like isoform X2 [Artemia franciscana]|uniref:alkaline phosphatase, tissue-nonspecific isozyme-like isoform X2 n=1 Tax=Artemia franciscana TaxID=6661 RepID=UPI0032DA252B
MIFAWIVFGVLMISQSLGNKDQEFWYKDAQSTILQRLTQLPRFSKAKNAIIFVADGLGMTGVTAARILKGQKKGLQGEDAQLTFERFPDLALLKTYANDGQTPDSASSATALFCGVKANLETIGLDSKGKFEDCISSLSSRVPSIFDWAQQQGKATGFVTTTRVTHGTPAALYSHSASRYWEDDSRLRDESLMKSRGIYQSDEQFGGRKISGPGGRSMCKDITRQLVEDEPGRNINVLMGGGRRHWLPQGTRDPEYKSEEGRRQDRRDLIEQWLKDKKKRGHSAEYVWNKAQFNKIDAQKTEFLLGLFDYSHLDFDSDRDQGIFGDPSLSDMSQKALEILKKNPHGYVLVVESGRIDHAYHYNNAYRALEEIVAFDEAVTLVTSSVNIEETIIIVTSDHSQVMTFGGAGTPRGNPILGS